MKTKMANVAMEQKQCIVTGKIYETGAILLKRRPSKDDDGDKFVVTGRGISPEVQEKLDEGYIALVEVDESKSKFESNGTLKQENAFRTGNMSFIKREAFAQLFDCPAPETFAFMQIEVFNYLKEKNDESSTN
jgi:hypothetical protein